MVLIEFPLIRYSVHQTKLTMHICVLLGNNILYFGIPPTLLGKFHLTAVVK